MALRRNTKRTIVSGEKTEVDFEGRGERSFEMLVIFIIQTSCSNQQSHDERGPLREPDVSYIFLNNSMKLIMVHTICYFMNCVADFVTASKFRTTQLNAVPDEFIKWEECMIPTDTTVYFRHHYIAVRMVRFLYIPNYFLCIVTAWRRK
jgi:hypothetical protein